MGLIALAQNHCFSSSPNLIKSYNVEIYLGGFELIYKINSSKWPICIGQTMKNVKLFILFFLHVSSRFSFPLSLKVLAAPAC